VAVQTSAQSVPPQIGALAPDRGVLTSARSALAASKIGWRLASLGLLFVLWWMAAHLWLDRVLPGPWVTLTEVADLLRTGLFYEELAITGYRVLMGFLLGFSIGMVVGSLMGLSRRIEALLELFVLTGVAAPGMFVAMIVLVALGINDRAAIVGIAVISAPSIVVSFWQTTKALDRNLDEMSASFNLTRAQRVRHVILPQLLPPALAATRYGLGYAWKLVVVLELLGLSNGIGYQVNFRFQLFDLRGVIAWTIGFMLFVLLLEYAVIRPFERWLTHWRDNGVKKGPRWLPRTS
jgi:NitT/TauT family transport system permease protein